jgi:gas vesicle protein
MNDPLATIYENSMLRGIGAALALGAAPLAAKDSVQDYKKAASQMAEYIKTFDSQIQLTRDFNKKMSLERQKNTEKQRLMDLIKKLRDMGVSDKEIRNLNK